MQVVVVQAVVVVQLKQDPHQLVMELLDKDMQAVQDHLVVYIVVVVEVVLVVLVVLVAVQLVQEVQEELD
jgi:hypothetical protein